ncbi:MAG: agmatinase [Chloroflexi bacterium]|nr:agmatinase [Chloroflexota bacterium]
MCSFESVQSRACYIPHNYLGLDESLSTRESSQVLVVQLPLEATTTYRAGTKEGPAAIIRASRNVELYDDELDLEPYLVGIHTLPEVDLPLHDLRTTHAEIEAIVGAIASEQRFPVILGGEHSVSVGAVRAFRQFFPDLSVLQMDAHADLRDSYSGTPFSHACAARRIIESCPLVQVGVRSYSREEADFLAAGQKDRLWSMERIRTSLNWAEQIVSALSQNVYVTMDLDVLDPSEMPSVGTPEPGGLHWREVLGVLRKVASSRNVVGIDLVELCPMPENIAPDFLAAKLAYKAIAYKFERSLRAKRGGHSIEVQ